MLKKNLLIDEAKKKQWYFLCTLFLGFWLIFTPYAINITQDEILIGDQISGLLTILFSIGALFGYGIFPWLLVFVGIYLQFAPLLFWADQPQAYLQDTVSGILLILFAFVIPGAPGIEDKDEGQIPKGWSYNPSSWTQRFPIIVFGTIGWFAARLMCSYQLGYISDIWDPFFVTGTEDVITSNVSKAFPVPDAGLGAMAYSLEVLLALKGRTARWRTMPWLVVGFSFLVVPLGLVSILLVILQPLVVGAWCSLCLLAAFCMLWMCTFTLDEVVAVSQLLIQAYKEKHFVRTFLYGTKPDGVSTDEQGAHFPQKPTVFLKEMTKGLTFEPMLLGSMVMGIFFMFSPYLFAIDGLLRDLLHAFGSLIVVVSVLSLAEVARVLRKINHVLVLTLLIATFFDEVDLITKGILVLGCIITSALNIPKGKTYETTG